LALTGMDIADGVLAGRFHTAVFGLG
jgi:hypothetical protein